MIRFSIIMPLYNEETRILRALDSIPVRNDIQIICIDDCSTDNTLQILREYTRLPLTIIHLDTRLKIGSVRNFGINAAMGEYLYALDGDDWFLTEKLNSLLDNFFYNDDIVRVRVETNNGQLFPKDIACAFYTMFIKRSFLGDIRCPDVSYAEDYFVLEELKKKSPKIRELEECVYHYNWPREGSAVTKGG